MKKKRVISLLMIMALAGGLLITTTACAEEVVYVPVYDEPTLIVDIEPGDIPDELANEYEGFELAYGQIELEATENRERRFRGRAGCDNEDCERRERRKRDGEKISRGERFNRFVEEGIITQETADSIIEHLENLKAEKPKDENEKRERIDILASLLEAEIITQDEYEKLREVMPFREGRTKGDKESKKSDEASSEDT